MGEHHSGLVKLLDYSRMESMMVVVCRWMHGREEEEFGLQIYKLYEELGSVLKLLRNTSEKREFSTVM